MLSYGDPESVYCATREHLRRLAPGGGYACGSSHDIGDSIPLDNVEAMIRAVEEFSHRLPGRLPSHRRRGETAQGPG